VVLPRSKHRADRESRAGRAIPSLLSFVPRTSRGFRLAYHPSFGPMFHPALGRMLKKTRSLGQCPQVARPRPLATRRVCMVAQLHREQWVTCLDILGWRERHFFKCIILFHCMQVQVPTVKSGRWRCGTVMTCCQDDVFAHTAHLSASKLHLKLRYPSCILDASVGCILTLCLQKRLPPPLHTFHQSVDFIDGYLVPCLLCLPSEHLGWQPLS
jgi:hypothetical protein